MNAHRHVSHHVAGIMLLSLAAGIIAATCFAILDLIYDRGGFVSMIVVFAALSSPMSTNAYRKTLIEKQIKARECVVCHE